MTNKEKLEDIIHIRAVRYGAKSPNGFSYRDIEKWYKTNREEEWEVVKVFLLAAKRNKENGLNIATPFQVLKNKGSADEDADFTLSYEAAFNYIDFLELQQARQNARSAFQTALVAIFISIVGMVTSIYFSQKQIESPTKLDTNQFHELIQAIEK